jgi:hypothetical protein
MICDEHFANNILPRAPVVVDVGLLLASLFLLIFLLLLPGVVGSLMLLTSLLLLMLTYQVLLRVTFLLRPSTIWTFDYWTKKPHNRIIDYGKQEKIIDAQVW